MNRFLLGILVGVIIASIFLPRGAEAQSPLRLFGTLSSNGSAVRLLQTTASGTSSLAVQSQ